MSKSLGNFVTINELLETDKFGGRAWPGEVLRLAMLMTHYRQPMDFSLERLAESEAKLGTWNSIISDLSLPEFRREPSKELVEILSDELNTPDAIAYLTRQENFARNSRETTIQFGADLCASGLAPSAFLQEYYDKSDDELRQMNTEMLAHRGKVVKEMQALRLGIDAYLVQSKISDRLAARAAKDWNESDRIRDELDAMGVSIKDNKDGTTSLGGQAMTRERLYLFDTTLRDGQQTPGVDFSLDDKLVVMDMLDQSRHRLCRGRLSRRQSDRYRALQRGPQNQGHLHRLRHGEAGRAFRLQ